ncbi:MAG: HEAT repeat domain-containing protein [Planctomycetes bacterium]|nr:HEAT repeat domain-containing protein [Planctomycetota bacterium]
MGQTSVCPLRVSPDPSAEPTPAEWAGKVLSDWRSHFARDEASVGPGEWDELRFHSFAALKRLGPESAAVLERAALDTTESLMVRTTALEALSEVDPVRAVEPALTLVQPSQPVPLRTAALLALIPPRDDRVLPALEGVLAERTFEGRYLAASALGRRRDAEAIPALERALTSDPSVTVRCHAAAALGDLGDERAWAILEGALGSDPSPQVRERLAATMAHLDLDRAVAVLHGIEIEDPSPDVRRTAALLLSPTR